MVRAASSTLSCGQAGLQHVIARGVSVAEVKGFFNDNGQNGLWLPGNAQESHGTYLQFHLDLGGGKGP